MVQRRAIMCTVNKLLSPDTKIIVLITRVRWVLYFDTYKRQVYNMWGIIEWLFVRLNTLGIPHNVMHIITLSFETL